MKYLSNIDKLVNAADVMIPTQSKNKVKDFIAGAIKNTFYVIFAFSAGLIYLYFTSKTNMAGAAVLAVIFAFVFEFFWPKVQKILNYKHLRNKYLVQLASKDAGRAMTLITNLDRMVKIICRIIYRKLKLKGISILIYNEKKLSFDVKCAHGSHTSLINTALSEDNIIISHLEGKPIYIQKKSPVFHEMSKFSADVCIPCISKGKLIAIILIDKKSNGKSISRSEVNLISLLATQGATAIENSYYYNKLREKTEELKSMFLESKKYSLGERI